MKPRHGLTQDDLTILKYYEKTGNRELYWNYLAQLPDNDGYGRLALGVVRNDNMPGATANVYAQNYAREHNHRVLSEREWDHFGIDLMERDLKHRSAAMGDGRADLALNLPAKDIQDAHDKSFDTIGVEADAWTPRKLLEASRAAGMKEAERAQQAMAARGEVLDQGALDTIREAHVEAVWAGMLNSDALGLHRGKDTLLSLAAAQDMPASERATYARDMAAAYVDAIRERAHESPDIIGRTDHYYARDRNGEWMEIHHNEPTIGVRHDQFHDVDPTTLRSLEETRELRLQRAAARDAFHPDDPGKLVASPHPLAETTPTSTLPGPDDDPVYAAMREQLPIDVTDDKVAEMATQARRAGIHSPDDLRTVDSDNDRITCTSAYGRRVEVSLDTTPPPKEESMALAERLDKQAMEAERAQLEQSQQLAMQRQMSRGRSM
ncbi:hypothetical protein [Luteibacter sp.]|jgi:hypothetical protein|uniref:hypothetical protein n=1 Tax=Luteibacter sp. TaxID=1886636 RepID=UPI002F4086F1